jgi:Uncharacterised protein family (UPF0175)
MRLDLPIPPPLLAALQDHLPDLAGAALEGLALEGYRHGVLSLAQVRELLGLSSRWEAQDFLASFGTWPDYAPETLSSELDPLPG